MTSVLSIVPYKYLPPKNGGHWGIVQVDELLAALANVSVLTVKSNLTEEKYPFGILPILPNATSRYIPFKLNLLIKNTLGEKQYDYIFAHHHYLFPSILAAAKSKKIPVYIRSHNIEAERFRSNGKAWWRLMWLFERWSYRRANAIFFVTEEDKNYAKNQYKIPSEKCVVLPFLTRFNKQPEYDFETENLHLRQEYNISNVAPIAYFLGDQSYEPNYAAVEFLLDQLMPLLQKKGIEFNLLIVGKGLPRAIQEKINANSSVQYLGFVDDLDLILKGSHLMLNPVDTGGGIKTKVIEALSWGKSVVSFDSGASGVSKSHTGTKLSVVSDNDTKAFMDAIVNTIDNQSFRVKTPVEFYDFFSIESNVEKIRPYFPL